MSRKHTDDCFEHSIFASLQIVRTLVFRGGVDIIIVDGLLPAWVRENGQKHAVPV